MCQSPLRWRCGPSEPHIDDSISKNKSGLVLLRSDKGLSNCRLRRSEDLSTLGRNTQMRRTLLSAGVLAFAVASAAPTVATANDELLSMQDNAKEWVMPTGNYANWRYSELNQITKDNVGDLQVAWTFSTGVLRGHEGGPLIIDDMMYVHTPFPNIVYAPAFNDNGDRKNCVLE